MDNTTQTFAIELLGNPEVSSTVSLPKGPCSLNIVAPFDTAVTVLPVNGLNFRDLDTNANVYSAEFVVPQSGQYTFKIMLSKPVAHDRLHISFFSDTNSGTNNETGNNNDVQDPLPAFPPRPTDGWRFQYYLFWGKTGFTRIDVVGWGPTMVLYFYHPNSNTAVYESLRKVRPNGGHWIAISDQIKGKEQGFYFSEDYTTFYITRSLFYILKKKTKI